MLIVAINGSPDPDGNTAFLLKRILAATEARGAETLLIHAAAKMPRCGNAADPCRRQDGKHKRYAVLHGLQQPLLGCLLQGLAAGAGL